MKIKFGAIVTDGRGKIGGHVASKNRGGAYLRTKVTPVNPRTSYQLAVRSRLAAIAQTWKTLTQAERTSFNAAVKDFARTNIFGDLKTPSGFNLYQRLNLNLGKVGSAFITAAPSPQEVLALTSLSVAAGYGAGDIILTFSPAIDAGSKVVIGATPMLSPGKSFVKSEYRDIMVADNLDTSPLTITSEYVAKFGAAVADQKVFFQMRAVDTTSGQAGQTIEASAIVS